MRFGVYWRCLAAYLSGWVIANAVFNRVREHWQKTGEAERFKREVADYVGDALIAKLESRDKELAALRTLHDTIREWAIEERLHMEGVGAVPDEWLLNLAETLGKVATARRGA